MANEIKDFDSSVLSTGTFIWVIHCDKIPPHIGISFKGRYFSLKANGRDINVDTKSVLQIIEARKISTLFYVLDSKIQEGRAEFERYSSTKPNSITCLTPINQILGTSFNTIHELLADFTPKGFIKNCYGLNLSRDFEGIPHYTLTEINNRLSSLQDD